MKRTPAVLALAVFITGCGGTYVDDKHNFERAFGAECPVDLRVVHSIYVQTPHFTEEHEYYFEMMPLGKLDMPPWLTNAPEIVHATSGLEEVPWHLAPRENRPEWFAPESAGNYDTWYHTNRSYVVLRKKATGEIFVYGSVGM